MLHAADGTDSRPHRAAQAVALLERGHFSRPAGAAAATAPRRPDSQASTAIARLRRMLEMHDWQHNMMFAPVAFLLMWSIHLAWAIEAWRAPARRARPRLAARRRRVRGAVVAVGLRLRASAPIRSRRSSTSEAGALLRGHGAGPPAGARARGCVPNDVSLGAAAPAARRQRLEHVGQEHAAAHRRHQRRAGAGRRAGARASRLRMSPLAVGATLRIQDSLQEGRSRFYAEITRIRAARRSGARAAAAAVPARRDLPRHQLARPPGGRRRACCAAASTAAPSVSSPRTTWR